jgi:cytochrome o ubiquinol oxidase subunit 2
VIPAGVPVHFRLTSASVMNSFFVPQLGSQIYTMAGMATSLNLMADRPGTYPGLSAQFSGDGFADMRFDVEAMPKAAFVAWLAAGRSDGAMLDDAAYAKLAQQSKAVPSITYRGVATDLFQRIVDMQAPGAEGAGQDGPKPDISPRSGS